MRQTVTALKALYVALGGDADDVAALTLIPDIINAIATVVSGTGGLLPAVDAEDNGKGKGHNEKEGRPIHITPNPT